MQRAIMQKSNQLAVAWRRLEDRFDDPTALIRKVQNELQGPPIRDWDGKELTILRDRMFNCESVYEAWGRSGELNSTDALMKVFERLPYKVKTQFI